MSGLRKGLAIALLAALLLGLLALAAGLPGMLLKEGRPFRLPPNDAQTAEALGGDSNLKRGFVLSRGLVTVIVVVYALAILFSLLKKEGRRKFLTILARLGALALFLYVFNTRGFDIFKNFGLGGGQSPLTQNLANPVAPLARFNPATPRWIPQGLLLIAAVILAAWAGALAWWWFAPNRPSTVRPSTARQKLSAEAEQAVQEIQAGEELEDVILRTYYRMERILAEQRGLARPEYMTPGEFAEALAQEGLPRGAVDDLTRLFEAARYGGKPLGPESQQRATNALRAIILAAPNKKVSFG
jgi:hypothetical protein